MATVRVAGNDMTFSLVWMTSSKLSARADPEAGTDHILKPHDFDALQRSKVNCYSLIVHSRGFRRRSHKLRSTITSGLRV